MLGSKPHVHNSSWVYIYVVLGLFLVFIKFEIVCGNLNFGKLVNLLIQYSKLPNKGVISYLFSLAFTTLKCDLSTSQSIS